MKKCIYFRLVIPRQLISKMLPIHSLSTWFNTFLSIYPKKRLLEPIIYSKECYSHYKSYSRFFFSIYSSSADGSPIRLSIGVLPK